MKPAMVRKTVCALAIFLASVATVKSQSTDTAGTTAEQGQSAPANEVVVTVNGHPITRSHVEELFMSIVHERLLGRNPGEAQLDEMRRRHWSEVVGSAVDNWLLDQHVAEAGIVVSDAEFADSMDKELDFFFAQSGMLREQFDARINDASGSSLHEMRAARLANPFYKQSLQRERWIAQKFPDQVKVTDEEIQDSFQSKWQAIRTMPPQVRASHILISTEHSKTDEDKPAARKKIERILAEARKPGADFAELARKHSACPSAPNGGDLGFFHRKGERGETFAEAAFALKVGQISDVVQTPQGYHIIKVTDRTEPQPATLELAKEIIRTGLTNRKIRRALHSYVTELRASADVVYPDQPSSE